MKIKTITCQVAYNYGASIRGHTLLFLNKQGWQASILPYKLQYLSRNIYFRSASPILVKPLLKRLYLSIKEESQLKAIKIKNFDLFHQKYISKDSTLITNNRELIKILSDDVFICGSIKIWSSFFKNGTDHVFHFNLLPMDIKEKETTNTASSEIDRLEKKYQTFNKIKRTKNASSERTRN